MVKIENYINYFITKDGRVWSKRGNKFLKPGVDKGGYLIVSLFENSVKTTRTIHQLVAIHYLNHIPNKHKVVIDHIDNNKLNNDASNLRLITQRENASKGKKIKAKTSDYTGVCWNEKSNKWQSYITINKRKIHLGLFENESIAHEAYQEKLKTITK